MTTQIDWRMIDGVSYTENFVTLEESQKIQGILNKAGLKQLNLKVFGKPCKTPRLVGAFALDKLDHYAYSGNDCYTQLMPDVLVDLKNRIEDFLELDRDTFNFAVVNLYRDGNDSIGEHRDKESCMDTTHGIASISLGTPRDFVLKSYKGPKYRSVINLADRSLLHFSDSVNTNYTHSVPIRKKVQGERFNITFRRYK